jgi:hypothetical protein
MRPIKGNSSPRIITGVHNIAWQNIYGVMKLLHAAHPREFR